MKQLAIILALVSFPVVARAADGEAEALRLMKNWGDVSRNENAPGKPFTVDSTLNFTFTDDQAKELADDLADIENLKTLMLAAPQLTDAGAKQLARLRHLETLILQAPKLTDTGLKHLTKMKQLGSVLIACCWRKRCPAFSKSRASVTHC